MKYTIIEKLLTHVVGFLQGVLLARLLCPSDFGLAAMLGIFLSVGGTLAESGLGVAYVVYGGDSRRVLRWNLGVAAFIYGVLSLAAPSIAVWYGHPILKNLMWVMGLGLILNAACVVGVAQLQREKKFRALSAVNFGAVSGAAVVGIVMAWCGCGVWAIAGVGLSYGAIRLLSLVAGRFGTSVSCAERASFGVLLSYGWKMTLSALVHTVYLNSYQLIIGKMFCPASVGLFHRGQRWATLPVDVVNDSVARVSLPSLAANAVAGRKYILMNVVMLWPCLVGLWLFANEVVELVLGSAWLGCVPYMRIMIVGVFFTPITNVSLNYLRAKGRADLILVTDAVKKPLQISALVCGAFFGVVGLCWAKVVSDVFEASVDFVFAWQLRRRIETAWFNMIRLRDLPVGADLVRGHEGKALDEYLSGRRIAVVGNGPSELGKGLGKEIDAHDIVIRINNYKIEGFERDYGCRCDVWMKGGAADVRHLKRAGVRAVLYTEDIVDGGLLEKNAKWPEEELKSGLIVDYVEGREWKAIKEAMGCRPSSGAILINRLLRIKGVSVDVYGFSFLEPCADDGSSGFAHYANDTTPENARYQMASAGHDLVKESEYLKKLFVGRRLQCMS